MTYRPDRDLKFLSSIKSSDLDDLVYCLTHDKDGDARLTEELTSSDEYEEHNPDHHQYWHLIAAEIQCFGANTFATIFRGGKGVFYKEVLTDVCKKMKVKYNEDSRTEKIEQALLMKILTDAMENMSPKELSDLAAATGIEIVDTPNAQAFIGAFQAIFRAGGFKSYQITVIVVNAALTTLIGRGLSFAGNAALTRSMAVLAGPIGWAITGAWTAVDIASPAYRVTIPAVIQVAALRQKYLYEKDS